MTRLLHTLTGTLFRKSEKLVNAPSVLRVATMASTTAVPTFRTAASPNRMSPPTGVNVAAEAFTSGGSTVIPMRRHSFR